MIRESAPTTASETKAKLREAWSQVLGVSVSQIGDNANFVRLGGSSINAIKLVAVLQKQTFDINTTQVLARPVFLEQAKLVLSQHANDREPGGTRVRTPEPFELL